jgi:hypothetical protein
MDLVSLNDAGITLCGLLGIALFYFIGKHDSEEMTKAEKKTGQDEKN